MFTTYFALLAVSATGLAQVSPGYHTVYMTSMVDTQYAITPIAAEDGSGIVVHVRDDSPEQQWLLQSGTSYIQLAGTTLCIDAGEESNWQNMALVHLAECDDEAASQTWEVMDDGRIALAASAAPQECIDLQYMRAVPSNPVGMYDCEGLGGIGAADAGLNWPLVDVEGTI